MNLTSNEPIFEQIYKEYKKLIELGIFKNGDKLPSVRDLAYELGINPNTVSRAYELLINDKLVNSIEKKGVYVSYKDDVSNINAEKAKDLINEIKNIGVKKEEAINLIEEIYGDDKQWLKLKIYPKVLGTKKF